LKKEGSQKKEEGRRKKEEGRRKSKEGSQKKEEGRRVSAIKNVLTVGRGCYITQILIEITPIHLMSWCGFRTLRKLWGADFAPYNNCFSLLPSSFFLLPSSFFLLLYYWCFRYSKTLLSPISCGIG
jgi:hypothetical protein